MQIFTALRQTLSSRGERGPERFVPSAATVVANIVNSCSIPVGVAIIHEFFPTFREYSNSLLQATS